MDIMIKNIKKLVLLSAFAFLTGCQTIASLGTHTDQVANDPVIDQKLTVKQQKMKLAEVDDVSAVSPAVSSLLLQAERQHDAGNIKASISSLERAIRIAPRFPESYYRLGALHLEEGHYSQARSLAQKAISLGASGEVRQQALALIEKSVM